MSGSTGKARGALPRTIGILVSVVALSAVVVWATRQPAPRLPSTGTEALALLGAIAVYAIATALRAERWLALLAHGTADPPRSDVYALTLVGFMGNSVLPARGGDAMRAYLMPPRAKTSVREVIGSLLAERVLDVLVLVTVFLALAYGILRGIDAPSGTAIAVVAAVAATLGLSLWVALRMARRSERGSSAIAFLLPLARATRALRGTHGARMLGMTLLIWTAEAGVYLLAASTVGVELSALEALYVLGVASMFVLVPAGPGYAGTLDAGILFGARAVGTSARDALSYLIMLRFVLLVPITIAGLISFLVRYRGRNPGSP